MATTQERLYLDVIIERSCLDLCMYIQRVGKAV